jgi:hypothetical protein
MTTASVYRFTFKRSIHKILDKLQTSRLVFESMLTEKWAMAQHIFE